MTFFFQALDEEYLKVDAQFGGEDQRKIFTFAEKVSNSKLTNLILYNITHTVFTSSWIQETNSSHEPHG